MHGEERKSAKEAFDTNWVSTVGKNLEMFEREICSCRYAVALSTGTAGFHLAVKLGKVGLDDKVFCSDMAFAAINLEKY